MDVKESIINQLKAIGVRIPGGDELSVEMLNQIVDLENPIVLRDLVKDAVKAQMQNDEQFLTHTYRKEMEYDFNAAQELLLTTGHLNEAQCQQIFSAIGDSVDNATDHILMGITANLPYQNKVNSKTATASSAVMVGMVQGEYQNYVTQGQLPPDLERFCLQVNGAVPTNLLSLPEYKALENQKRLLDNVATAVGSRAQAITILAAPVDDQHPLLQNAALYTKYIELKANPHDPIRVMDIMCALTKSAASAQVMAFYENRVKEQNDITDDKKRLPLDSPHRIDNAVGKEGIKATEKAIGKPLANNLNPATKAANGASLPDHKWRGYGKLASLIKQTVKDMYSMINTGALVLRLVGYTKRKDIADRDEQLNWDTEYQEMPAAYQNTQAADFFQKVQARLMFDKVEAVRMREFIESQCHDFTFEELIEYASQKFTSTTPLAFSSDPQRDRQAQSLMGPCSKLLYYQNRIAEANSCLQNLDKTAKEKPALLNDPVFMGQLNNQILNLNVGMRANELPEAYQSRQDLNNALMTQPVVAAQANHDLNTTASDDWIAALDTFLTRTYSAGDDGICEMLAHLYGVHDRYDPQLVLQNGQSVDGVVSKEELLDLMHSNTRFGPFNPNIVRRMMRELQSGQLTPEVCRQTLHNSAVSFMRGKHLEAATNYDLIKQTADNIRNM